MKLVIHWTEEITCKSTIELPPEALAAISEEGIDLTDANAVMNWLNEDDDRWYDQVDDEHDYEGTTGRAIFLTETA